VLALVLALLGLAPGAASASGTGTYSNPLTIQITGDGRVESCADPSVIRGQTSGDNYWYMYCTKDPLNDEDRNSSGDFNFHNIPMMKSLDLVNWTYVGDAFSTVPA
jgi:arabinan endo-1,5-alpha-L-arabinosidase